MTSKKILTIIYLNKSIALAKVAFSGKTANVSNYSEFSLPEGTIENAIVYDPRTVSAIVKEYINAVGFKQIDKTVSCIPDNKVKIFFYTYNSDIPESQNEDNLTNLVESEMGTSMQQLSVIADTYTKKGTTYTVIYAIRKEILDPYITSSRFGASIFPASLALSQALSKNLTEPTVVIYPRGNSLRFFIYVDGHVVANGVEGKNVLEIDNNLSYGISEIITHGEGLIHQPIKKVLFIEGKKVSRADIQSYVEGASGFEVDFFRTKDATLDQYKFLALKGLIKKINDTGLEKPSIKKRIVSSKSGAVPGTHIESNNARIAILATVILALLVGLIVAVGYTYFLQNQRKPSDDQSANNNTQTTTVATTAPTQIDLTTTVPTSTSVTLTVTETVLPSLVTPAKTRVQVLNGSGTSGQAKDVANIVATLGFPNIQNGNKPPYNTQKTVVTYLKGFESMADLIVDKLKGKFPFIYKQEAATQAYDVIVTTGDK